MNRNFYIFILVVIILFICLANKIFNIYNNYKTSYIFASYQGFEVDGDTIVKYNNHGKNVTIPSTINGTIITKIGDHAFDGLGITNVIIPNTIIKIGEYAFANNQLQSLTIPNSIVDIGEGAFIHNAIKSLELPDTVMLGNACFNDNQLDRDEAFFYKRNSNHVIDYSKIISYGGKARSGIEVPNLKNGVNLLTIGEKAFYETGIISITIPNSVNKIEKDSFNGNYLVEVYLPNNIKDIAVDAFSNNSYLSDIIIDNYENILLNYPWGADDANIYWTKK